MTNIILRLSSYISITFVTFGEAYDKFYDQGFNPGFRCFDMLLRLSLYIFFFRYLWVRDIIDIYGVSADNCLIAPFSSINILRKVTRNWSWPEPSQ